MAQQNLYISFGSKRRHARFNCLKFIKGNSEILYFFDGKAIITIFEQTKNPEIRHICLKTGFKIFQVVVKVQRIPNFQATLPLFSVEDNFHFLYNQFLQTDLGKIYTAIPWDDLVRIFKLQENKKGPASIFSPRGKIALMLLKHYSGCSDKRLIEQFNGNIYYQFFCQTFLEKGEYIKNYKIVSQIRCEISKKLDIKETQKVLAAYWRPYMEGCDQIMMDATCYESSMRYPTDQKLLWESVE